MVYIRLTIQGMRTTILVATFIFCFLSPGFSQAPQNWTSSEMYLAIRKLNVLGSVLYVAAHPDDENTRLIAYFAKDKMYRAGYLSLTRGDGGQNLIGDEQGIELGLIRTQELLAARRIDGGEQFFSRAFDFGYSKNPEETFTKWDKEKILSDVVWVIRKFQPDVIITRFPTTGEGGHGHHTASAILANEAFTAAADPARFPEHLKYVQVWKAKRILWNSFNFGGTNLTSNDQFKFDVGGYNPLLGKSYGEIAAISRSNHKSQGFGSAGTRGEALEYFRTTGGDAPVNDIMDGIELGWKRVQGGDIIEMKINSIASSFDLLHPENSVRSLVDLYQALEKMPDGYWRTQKMQETRQLIEQCSGLFIDAVSPSQFAVQTDSVRINFALNNRLGVNAVLKGIAVDAFDSTFSLVMDKNKNLFFSKTFFVPADKPLTQPYWLANKMEEGYFNVSDQQKIGQPDVDAAYTATVKMTIEGQDFNFTRPVKYKFTDPVKGEIYQPVTIVPSLSVNIRPDFLLGTKEIKNRVTVDILSLKNTQLKNANLHMGSPDINGDIEKPGVINMNLGKNQSISYEIDGPGFPFLGPLNYSLKESNHSYNKSMVSIKHDHVPAIVYFRTAEIPFVSTRLNTYGKKIGYIVGAGDKVTVALEQMGYEVTLLGDKELSRNNLRQFDAIITGVRAYNTNEWLNNYYDKLMKYVEDGGNLIVQYNTSNQLGPVRAKIAPYNFNIGRSTRITNENAPVVLLKPDHPVLNFPNKITQDDFKGWTQERSIYHATSWDSTKFETVIAMNDPDEKPHEGSLLIAKHGKGVFVYTGIVFFRELPAGVPGAYRLLANIIALNRKKGF
jgi:LmbE family N-acetylglucosaminyl deacetylase